MTEQEKREVIKALSYGYTAEDIIKVVDVTAAEVEEIAAEKAADIEGMKKYHAEMEG